MAYKSLKVESPCQGDLEVVVPEADIQRRVAELAREMAHDYQGREPVLVGILSGAVPFLCDLARGMNMLLRIDFLSVVRFRPDDSQRRVAIEQDVQEDLEGRHVILVDDRVETGFTLRFAHDHLSRKRPASLRVCALMSRASLRLCDTELDYVGFETDRQALIGYGADFQGHYRNLPHLVRIALDL